MTRVLTIACTIWLKMIRRKDAYVLLILTGMILVTLVSLDIFGLGGAVGYVKDIGFLMAWVFAWILTITVATRELPQEEDRGTIFPLLAKPLTRFELIVGKWLGCWSIVSLVTLLFYLLVMLVVIFNGGTLSGSAVLQGYALHSVALGIIAALAVAFSTRLNQDAAASMSYILTASAFLVLPRVPALLVYQKGFSGVMLLILYYLLPHFEIFDMRKRLVHSYGAMDWRTFLTVCVYGILFVVVPLLLAWLAYRGKQFSRGSARSG